jgi:TonB family protein
MTALAPFESAGGELRTRRGAFAASVALHALLVVGLASLPGGVVGAGHAARGFHLLAPLIAPPPELTQTAPQRGPVGREFTVESLMPRLRLPLPPGQLLAPRRSTPQPSLPEPPPIEAPLVRAQPPLLGASVPVPPPQIEPVEKPKLAFETPGAPSGVPAGAGKIAPPGSSVQEAVRSAIRRGPSGGLLLGDFPGGSLEGVPLPPSPGGARSNLELLSDPRGVDFRPYLIQVLASVRRNWLAVIPESARMGRRGKVQIQFAIARDGYVPKLVIAVPSGADALDRAAVAGISASNPFPPLPAEFRGDQIRLQLSFFYNVPAQ